MSQLTIGWIGCGVMGSSMAGHLLRHGHALTVHTRTRARAEALLADGARWADDPREAAEGADVVCSIVGYPDDVRAVHLGPGGTLEAKRSPRVIVDLTTSPPSLAEEIAGAARTCGVGSVDAPVSGGDVGAREATLSIMVGGAVDDVAYVRPILEKMGGRIVHQGGPGSGQHTKMVNQILIASTMMGVAEGLLYASRAGLDATRVIESVGGGAAGSWTINNLGPRMVRRDFEPGFYVEHFIKDLEIALAEAERMGLQLPGLALARRLYEAVRADGHDRQGTQALLLTLEAMNGGA
ncbi:MAG: NAD(P)-dependent oxidoreductase [Planctomycetes bacterium]|nr:NAD(P)-dependent oxidoreductase [Planctomycetota bacterium]